MFNDSDKPMKRWHLLGTETCIIPIFIGDDTVALKVCQELLEIGIFTTPVVFPAAQKGKAIIRCSVMATHTKEDLQKVIDAFAILTPLIKEVNQLPNKAAILDHLDKFGDDTTELSKNL